MPLCGGGPLESGLPQLRATSVNQVNQSSVVQTLKRAIVRRKELKALLGVSLASVDRWRRAGNFPQPVKLGAQAVGFRLEDLEAWLASRLKTAQ